MKTIYVTVLGLALVSGSAFAAVNHNNHTAGQNAAGMNHSMHVEKDTAPTSSLHVNDDDDAIANVGETFVEMNGAMHEKTNDTSPFLLDDDDDISQVGKEGGHIAHSADVEAELFLPND